MNYINKSFSIEKVKAQNLAKKFNTPIYCYSFNKPGKANGDAWISSSDFELYVKKYNVKIQRKKIA